MPSIENETIISYNDVDDEAEVYTTQKVIINRLNKMCKEYPNQYIRKGNHVIGGDTEEYIVDKKLVAFRKPRILTMKQKIKLLSNFRK